MDRATAKEMGDALARLVHGRFPNWMGVRGRFNRHIGQNPGTFAVMMNADYYGLYAEVILRVNGLGWTECPMTYAGHTNGHSIWIAIPDARFRPMARVEFYFRGRDVWGNEICDGDARAPYVFSVPRAPRRSPQPTVAHMPITV